MPEKNIFLQYCEFVRAVDAAGYNVKKADYKLLSLRYSTRVIKHEAVLAKVS